jgi:hypothetical protein
LILDPNLAVKPARSMGSYPTGSGSVAGSVAGTFHCVKRPQPSLKTQSRENQSNYIEFPVASNAAHLATKQFYGDLFNWKYPAWSDDYFDTKASGIASGKISRSHRFRRMASGSKHW